MGWWKIRDVESGQIDLGSARNGLLNKFPGADPSDGLYNGDGPADLMVAAIESISKEYVAAWGRKPTRQELQAVFNFVVNPLFEKNAEKALGEVNGYLRDLKLPNLDGQGKMD